MNRPDDDQAAREPARDGKHMPAEAGNSHGLTSQWNTFDYPDIAGYIIERSLGEGAHGCVFKAMDIKLRRPVAIKVLTPVSNHSPQLRERFEREVRAYHSLKDGHIIQPRSHGRISAGTYKNCPYIIMEYMDGGTFWDWMSRYRADSKAMLRASIEILIEVCKGLEYLHKHGIVHRDLKPENILLAEISLSPQQQPKAGQVRLSDFGLIADLSEDRNLSRSGMGVGTPPYMSPEQFRDAKNITPASDQWAIGVMLYQLISGRRPWQTSATQPEPQGLLEAKFRSKTPCPPPSSATGKVDAKLREICLRCLDPNPSERYENVTHLRESLDAWLNGQIDPHSRSWLKRHWRTGVLHPIQRRPGRFLLAMATILLLCFSCSWILYRLAYVWPSVSRFASATNFEGLPVGQISLTRSGAQQRQFHYQFVRDGWYGPLRSVSLNNRWGGRFTRAPLSVEPLWMFQNDPDLFIHAEITPFDIMGRLPVAWTYDYAANGELLWITESDCLGNPITRKQFKSRDVVEYEAVDAPSTLGQATQLALNPIPQAKFGVDWGTDIEQVEFHWDQNGLCDRKMYFGRRGAPTRDAEGAFGWTYQRDTSSRVIERQAVGPTGLPINGDDGYATQRVRYIDGGQWHTFFDKNGIEVTRTDIGASRIHIQFNSEGAVDRIRTYDHETPVVSTFGGPEVRLRWTGSAVQIEHMDTESSPWHRGDGVHRVAARFHDDGRLGSVNYFDLSGIATEPRELGAHRLELRYDASHRIESLEMFDSKGSPQRGELGASKTTFRWSPRGLPVGMSLYHDQEKVVGRFLAHRTSLDYDDAHRLKTWRCWGPDGEAVDCLVGFHSREFTYDSTGQVSSVSFWHSGNKPAVNSVTGYHRAVWTYDEKGNETAWESFGSNNKPIVDRKDGYHRIERQYDDNSNNTITICYDTQRHRTRDAKGVCEYRVTWEHGQKSSTAVFDIDSRPIKAPGGEWHKWTRLLVPTDDQRHRHYEFRYWGPEGEKVNSNDGYHLVHEVEDDQGNIIEGSYFDENHRPVAHPDGYHAYRSEYDQLGRQTSGSAFGLKREPILAWAGYHKWIKAYDSYGNEIAGHKFDIDSKTPMTVNGHHSWRATYAASGEQLSWACFLPSGGKAVCERGFHRWERKPDKRGELSAAAYYDDSDNLLLRVARLESGAMAGLRTQDFIYGKNGRYDSKFVAQLLEGRPQFERLPGVEGAAKWLGLASDRFTVEVVRDGRVQSVADIKSVDLATIQVQEFFMRIP